MVSLGENVCLCTNIQYKRYDAKPFLFELLHKEEAKEILKQMLSILIIHVGNIFHCKERKQATLPFSYLEL